MAWVTCAAAVACAATLLAADGAIDTAPPTATVISPPAPVEITDAQRAEANKVYVDLFGEREKQVRLTPDTADDLTFAKSLLEAAGAAANTPALQSLLMEKTYDAAIVDAKGLDIAIEAMDKLIGVDPAREAFGLQRKREAYQQVFATARGDAKIDAGGELLDMLMDEADAKSRANLDDDAMTAYREALKVATSIRSPERDTIRKLIEQQNRRIIMLRKADQLKDRLKADPKDTDAATDLVMLYLVDLNSPIDARKYTFLLQDDALKQNIRDASKDPAEVEPLRALALGDWYTELAGKAGGTARWNLLSRSEAHYQAFVDSDVKDDLARSKAKFALDRTKKALAALEQTMAPAVRSVGKVAAGNVALAERGAHVRGVANHPDELLDGNSTKYTGSTGFAYSSWPCEWVVELPTVYALREIRMLLWDIDRDKRYYRYAIDVSKDGKKYVTVVDRTGDNERPMSWQLIKLRPTAIKFIRVRGTYNNENSGFHVVELEAYCNPPRDKPKTTFGEG
ncbi:MAG: hypothetical protein GC159_11950 [Phycisphaera sp.]|nr:hypothetical protein [Phycisphaera sp.]